jgi:DNA-binding LytR/AlgR family response regulator
MDVKTGIDVAHFIKSKYKISFIYLTSYSDPKTVKEATISLPEAYLIKPFSKNDLFSTLEMVKARKEVFEDCHVVIKEGNNTVKIALDELVFIKSEKNYLEIFTRDKRYIARHSIESFISELSAPRFIRVHRSFAVNLNQVTEVSSNSLKVRGENIPISRNFKNQIKNLF